ncbi:DUF2190 family protein [Luteimonas sp. M1R5S18]|uniref:DUF2190 family protein n=1 Tax=Luteimonas rhizosphaericola TaxID=3042024 RepID=A0ABT6JNB3_9GAMM|nr:DUF2190 family protein [Luteimonas rhizosphaericola]MDH5832162.1 DUF2190 family protein [Luteimonas rhizosphaericola]
MKNYHQDGRVLDVTLAANVASGGVVSKGRLFGVAVTSGSTGDIVPVHVEGVVRLAKLGTAVIAQGDAVHWDVSASQVIVASTATGDIENFGYAVEAAGNGTTEVLVRLCPGAGVPKAA